MASSILKSTAVGYDITIGYPRLVISNSESKLRCRNLPPVMANFCGPRKITGNWEVKKTSEETNDLGTVFPKKVGFFHCIDHEI